MLSVSFTFTAIILMVGLSVLLSTRYSVVYTNNLQSNSERLTSQINTNLDQAIRSVMRTSDSLYYRVLKRFDMNDAEMAKNFKLIYDTGSDKLVSVSLFDMDGQLILSQPYSSIHETAAPAEEDWFKNAAATIENIHFSEPHVQNLYMNVDDSYQWVVSVSRSVELTRNGVVSQGILLLDLNFSSIYQTLRSVDPGTGAYLFLTDQTGNLLYHPRQQLISSGLDHEASLSFAALTDDVYMDDANQRAVNVQTIGYTGWKLVLVTPTDSVIGGAGEIQAFTMLFILIAIALIVLVNFLISSRIARPIKQLEEEVAAYEGGGQQAFRSLNNGSPEITHLGNAIASLVTQQEILRQDILQEQEAKRRSELEALQAQIHPHFLYNTLDSIVWMIENQRFDGAVEMVTSLARFFRLSLAKGRSIITVANEIEQVRNYLAIQQVRFRDQFTYSIEMTEEAAPCRTIKLIVQPLVENAIYHGTSKLGDGGHIQINAYCSGELLCIDVIDNGLGMTPDQQQAISRHRPVSSKSQSGSGIGIANVDERIQLFFGRSYGLSIVSAPDEGTCVEIRLPRQPYTSEDGGSS